LWQQKSGTASAPARQRQTKERRAGSADANEREPSQSSGEVALQRNFPASFIATDFTATDGFLFSYRSCAITSGGSTRVAQPTIMLRKSVPSVSENQNHVRDKEKDVNP